MIIYCFRRSQAKYLTGVRIKYMVILDKRTAIFSKGMWPGPRGGMVRNRDKKCLEPTFRRRHKEKMLLRGSARVVFKFGLV